MDPGAMSAGRARPVHFRATRLWCGLLWMAGSGLATTASAQPTQASYAWLRSYDPTQSIGQRIAPPPGYVRVAVEPGSFGEWLRGLPLKEGSPLVLLHNGKPKGNQSAQIAVLELDVGRRDLQQCADAVIRLRAEYLWSRQAFDRLHFDFTSGDRADYARWREGFRPRIERNRASWSKVTGPDESYAGFRRYLDSVFTYAGSASLSRELETVPVRQMRSGDVIIQGGFPGHAVIVVDLAAPVAGDDAERGGRLFLLAQSYMPAQEMHILKNPEDPSISPWYRAATFGGVLITPEWIFKGQPLKTWKE